MSSSFAYEKWVYGYEKDFIEDVIGYLTGLDSRITCSSDVDTEYDTGDLTHVPKFDFSINGKIAFSLERPSALSDPIYTYTIKSGDYSSSPALKRQGPVAYNALEYRCFPISHIVSSGFILLSIGGFGYNSGYSNLNLNIIYAESGNKYYSSIFTGINYDRSILFNIAPRALTEIDSNSYGTFQSRFSYTTKPGKIDYIKSSIYANNGSKEFDILSLYDCSNVSVGQTISLKDGPYLAVGTNQVVKI